MEKSYTNRFNSFKNSLASLEEAKGKDKDDIWLSMLDDRNNLTHDYDYLIVAEKFDEIVDKYIEVFEKFRSKVDEIIRET